MPPPSCATVMATPKKRQNYDAKNLATKVEILEALKNGESRQQVMTKYNVKRSTLGTYVKNEQQIRQAFESEKFHASRKRLRTAAHPQLEEALLRWITDCRNAHLPLSGPLIMAQGEKYAAMMNIESFKASEGWFARFRERHELVFRSVCGEKASVDESVTTEWRNVKLLEHIAAYEPRDVFNADETALFFRALPDKTVTFKGDACIGGKKCKQRITVLLAANMTGTERLPLLVVGKALKPRCFKNVKSLPVEYTANRKAWMTSDIFRGWLQQLDRHFTSKDRKIIMVVDNCSAHNCTVELKSIKVVFLPPNTTSALQPMDQGIIHYVKSKYRKHLLERMILCSEAGKLYQVDLLGAVHIIAHVWKNTPPQVIANCFRHSGFVRPEHAAVADDGIEEVSAESTDDDCPTFDAVLPTDVTFQDYIAIDHGVATSGLLTDQEIINDVTGAHEDHDSDEESCEEIQPRPHRTSREVSEALLILEDACLNTPDSLRAVGHLEQLRKIVMSARICAKMQTTITKYFNK